MPKFNPTPLFVCLLMFAGFACQKANEPAPAQATTEETNQPALTDAWTLETGLDRPESVIFDTERKVLYVTNLVGDAAKMDNNGYIARISPFGEIVEERWVDNLNAPKGIALAGDILWASDINALVEIDIESGQVLNRFELEGSVYLNDVSVHPDGSVYVSDSRFSKIYKYAEGSFELWLEDDAIQMPNGLHVIGDELMVVAGDGSNDYPGQSRYFQAISLADKSIRKVTSAEPNGALDAVEPDGNGGIFTTDWASGRLMYFKEGEGTKLLKQLGKGAADVDYISQTNMLYVPVMEENQLIAYRVD